MIISGTGHRPDKIHTSNPYSDANRKILIDFAKQILLELKPDKVISGGALGYDTALAMAAIELNIPTLIASPFLGQESKWPRSSQEYYQNMCSRAEVYIVCEGGYSPHKMQTRNEWMVDNSDKVLALWDGSSGGTGNCVAYATGKKEIINVWEKWEIIKNGYK